MNGLREYFIVTVFLCFLLLIPLAVQGDDPEDKAESNIQQASNIIKNFQFEDTDRNNRSISEYTTQEFLLLHWGASWCPLCKTNNAAISSLYSQGTFEGEVTYLSLSYGGSGDDLDDVIDDKASYEWDFGLDINNYAAETEVSPKPRNAHTWIVNQNMEVVHIWSYQTVSSSQLKEKLNELLDGGSQDSSSQDGSSQGGSEESSEMDEPDAELPANSGVSTLAFIVIGIPVLSIIIIVIAIGVRKVLEKKEN